MEWKNEWIIHSVSQSADNQVTSHTLCWSTLTGRRPRKNRFTIRLHLPVLIITTSLLLITSVAILDNFFNEILSNFATCISLNMRKKDTNRNISIVIMLSISHSYIMQMYANFSCPPCFCYSMCHIERILFDCSGARGSNH